MCEMNKGPLRARLSVVEKKDRAKDNYYRCKREKECYARFLEPSDRRRRLSLVNVICVDWIFFPVFSFYLVFLASLASALALRALGETCLE